MHLSLTGKSWHLPARDARVPPSALTALLAREREIELGAQGALIGPCVYPDMQRAVERIKQAVAAKERIAIFGDYDCDGVTSTAQLVRYFQRHEHEPIIRLPHRMQDGYGLNPRIVDEFIEQEVSLLITVDTGIASIAEISELQGRQVDVIITDHHQHAEELPPAYAIVHPALAPKHPSPHPAGAGVAYQLVRALEGADTWSDSAVDQALAMIGTVADLVELRGNNRLLVQQGLRALAPLDTHPLAQLFEVAGTNLYQASSTDIAFRIAPRINAAGRMADPLLALEALLQGGQAVQELDQLNADRQDETSMHIETALKDMTDSPLAASCKEEYGHGIVGLIAGKLTEQSGRPSMAATIDGDICTASLRSPKSYHITEGLQRCKHLLLRFGGHAQAAGCTFEYARWQELCQALSEDIQAHVSLEELVPSLHVDLTLAASDITLSLVRECSNLAPYGQGNPEPLFLLPQAQVSDTRRVGKDQSHLQARIHGIKAIGFGLGELEQHCTGPLDLVCRLGVDNWQGKEEVQLYIVDMRVPVQVAEKEIQNPKS